MRSPPTAWLRQRIESLSEFDHPQGPHQLRLLCLWPAHTSGSTGYTYDATETLPTERQDDAKSDLEAVYSTMAILRIKYDAEVEQQAARAKRQGKGSYVWNRRGQLTQIDVHSNAAMDQLTGQVNYSYDRPQSNERFAIKRVLAQVVMLNRSITDGAMAIKLVRVWSNGSNDTSIPIWHRGRQRIIRARFAEERRAILNIS